MVDLHAPCDAHLMMQLVLQLPFLGQHFLDVMPAPLAVLLQLGTVYSQGFIDMIDDVCPQLHTQAQT